MASYYEDEYDDDWDNEPCWNCDGERFVSDCFDGFCLDADFGCDLCTYRCPICNPKPPATES
jgi:hypothetical protein